ncbi:RES domain-containing protein [Rhodobacteraceae bacterium 2CG4]|uniref:RES domain-containing protein n=1 Tax=Halovulum marinum TaxID=2662447 RepID=A0A6L5Z3P2_9RHOB|nr:RES family NAD+ phosphorylase [Halovulum marinum]MSU90919.1 RES domain-containing protein [Halovulum marinum]
MRIIDYDVTSAPAGTSRLIPSRFPPVSAFEAVAAADDLDAVMYLEGWTNDRLVAPRLERLPRAEWVYGRPNASVVMAAFLHGSPGGLRFTDSSLGAWYCSTSINTALLEVANGLREEIALSALTQKAETYRQYRSDLAGDYVDIFGAHPENHDPDDACHPETQAFGRRVREEGARAGIRYESVRHPGHENWVCFRPSLVLNVTQASHFRIEVPRSGRVVVRQLS